MDTKTERVLSQAQVAFLEPLVAAKPESNSDENKFVTDLDST